MKKGITGLVLLMLAAPVAAQDKSAKAKAERAHVDAAIEKGLAYLRRAPEVKGNAACRRPRE